MSQNEEEVLKLFIGELFDKYDKQKKGCLSIEELCSLFNDLFQELNVQLTINSYQATKAIQLINPDFKETVTKDQAFHTFKSMISHSEKNPVSNQSLYQNQAMGSVQSQPQVQPQMQMQMQTPYMMQMPVNGMFNPMMAQQYQQYGNGNFMGQFAQGQFTQAQYAPYNQWGFGNFQNNYPR